MAAQLSVAQKKQLIQHKLELEKDGRKMPYKDQLAYCQENFKQSASASAISRIWLDRDQWLNSGDDNPKAKRIRGAKWADLEKGLVLWITQVCLNFISPSQSFAAIACFCLKCFSTLPQFIQ